MAKRQFRSFQELNQARLGLVGIVLTALVLAVCLNIGKLRSALEDTSYHASFAESGGLLPGDDVRVSGLKIGEVKSVKLNGNQVEVSFAASNLTLGNRSTAAVKSANALGRKYLAITPGGSGKSSTIPRSRTNSGYAVTTALGGLTTTTAALNVNQISESIASMTTVLDQTPTEFRGALRGVTALSRTLASRDEALGQLLRRTSSLSGVLAERNQEITAIMTNGSLLFRELDARRQAVQTLLSNVQSVSTQLIGFVNDNKKTLKPALTELRGVARILKDYRGSLDYAAANLASFASGLGEAVGSGPFFQAYVENITEPQSLAPVLSGIMDGKN